MIADRAEPRPGRSCNFDVKHLNRLRRAGSIAAGPVLVFIALFTSPPSLEPLYLRLGGALLLGAGIALRLWAQGSIDGHKKRVLVTWGAYRYLRHPLYAGSLLASLGFCVLLGSLAAGIVACLLFATLYLPAVRAEERLLAAQFGAQWEHYRRHVGALLPSFATPLPRVHAPFRILRPVREICSLVAVALGAVGTAELARLLHRSHDLPGWFL